ncbi:[protein-PII] uridylyltransferase [Sutterella sp.]|uniref:[protein-PII] uridylyltransferase n=1 Tax=Sutterella sp. TaxID=1981025 RepID=UPI0026DF270B|nr:[protein-PII] uridylyltransferase [Sutterella sp.]MDO5530858.1 [protein-PII] uridylyltransferase [Sutterella sp.]
MPQDLDPQQVTAVRERFHEARARLAQQWRERRDSEAYLRAHAAALDEAIISLGELAELPPDRITLAAVGGFGRRELFPHSDIDLLVLLTDEAGEDRALGEKLSGFLAALWELGLTVGAAVRTRTEYTREAGTDVSIATTYLESRRLWGSAELYADARDDFFASLDAGSFFRDKMLELQRRHQKYESTPYSLEPNLKESPGGLRDLQTFLWCVKAAGIAESVEEMHEAELITEREMHTIEQCFRFLSNLRIELHLLTSRDENRLLFDVQESLAGRLGYKATGMMRASEALMKRYYWNAKSVVQMSVIQLQAISDRLFGGNSRATPVRIDPAFLALGDEMDIVDEEIFEKDTNAILRVFLVFARRPEITRFSTRLLRALWHATPLIGPAYRENPVNQKVFLDILQLDKFTDDALKMMNAWAILGRFLPAFRHVVGQMQHDLYHIFTVDQHSILVVQNLCQFRRSEHAHEYPLCTQLMTALPGSWRLLIAGLFHDIGKGLGGGHEAIGAEKARIFCERFGLSEEDSSFICFLVLEHLMMSRVSQKEDISDPKVVERFARIVGTKERLDALYLLTVADIRATSPKVWTPWKAQLLETLYKASLEWLSGGSLPDTVTDVIRRRQAEAAEKLAGRVSPEARERLWKELDLVYFMRHSSDEIAWHAEMLAGHVLDDAPVVRVKRSEMMGGLVFLIYLPDRKDLFLRAVAWFGKNSLSVVDARVHTTRHGWALDTFLVTDSFNRFDTGEKLALMEEKLAAGLISEKPLPPAPQARFSRRSRHFPTRPFVKIGPDESGRAFILNLVGTDRIGLLYSISQVLAKYGVNLQTAKIATLGERAEDVFLIDGEALHDDTRLLALEGELIEALLPHGC